MKFLYIIVSVAVLVALGVILLRGGHDDTIEYEGHRIPTSQLRIADPHPGCEYIHYHAADVDSVSATDGTVLVDSTDCGFGPVSEGASR